MYTPKTLEQDRMVVFCLEVHHVLEYNLYRYQTYFVVLDGALPPFSANGISLRIEVAIYYIRRISTAPTYPHQYP